MAFGAKNFPTSLDDVLTLLPARDTAATQLTATFSAVETATMTVGDTSRFPAAGVLTFKGEHIGYTGKTSTTFTGLTRANFTADGGAAAQSGGIGDPVRLAHSARFHNVLADLLLAIEAKLGIGASTPSTIGRVLTVTAVGQTQWLEPIGFPTGGIMAWPITSVPGDFLECNGALISRTTYANLFATISTAYGVGDGSTTFGIPDLRGKAIFGYKAADPDFGTLGASAGAADVTLTSAQSGSPAHAHANTFATGTDSPDHSHSYGDLYNSGTIANANSGGQTDWNTSTSRSISTGGRSAFHTHAITGSVTNNTAADAASSHENLPPYFTGKWIIKI